MATPGYEVAAGAAAVGARCDCCAGYRFWPLPVRMAKSACCCVVKGEGGKGEEVKSRKGAPDAAAAVNPSAFCVR